MGNTKSSEGFDEVLRKQKISESRPKLYDLVDVRGGGDLIPWMRYMKHTGDSSIIDEFIETNVSES